MFDYIISLSIISLIWTLLVQSYNLSFGLTGLFNLGHIVFYGVGAYTAAILNTRYGFGFFENIGMSALISAIVAVFFGLLTLRLNGHYLAIATLGAAMISQVVALNWVSLTRGPLGIRGIAEPDIFGQTVSADTGEFVLLYGGIVALSLVVLYKLFHSPFGRLLRAIQDDETAAKSVGKDTFSAKMWSLVISAAFAGIAGAMYAHYRLFLDPSLLSLHEIILLIMIVIIGGRGKFWGAILGTFFVIMIVGEVPRFIGFPETIIGAARNMLYAIILMATMYWRPEGIFGRNQKKKVDPV